MSTYSLINVWSGAAKCDGLHYVCLCRSVFAMFQLFDLLLHSLHFFITFFYN